MTGQATTILIIEDDDAIRLSLRDILETENYHVEEAMNGRIGLDIFKKLKGKILILLDLMMPEMNGYRFLELVNEDSKLASHSIVIMSASRDAAAFAAQNKRPFLAKPIDVTILLDVVAKNLV